MKITFLMRLLAYWQGNKVVTLYSTSNNRVYTTIAVKSQEHWVCQFPIFDKEWEYISITLLTNGNLKFTDSKFENAGIDRWR
jgi:ABC-type bacteriocin/lantibiotic exporter with double-glycine peptidase domain